MKKSAVVRGRRVVRVVRRANGSSSSFARKFRFCRRTRSITATKEKRLHVIEAPNAFGLSMRDDRGKKTMLIVLYADGLIPNPSRVKRLQIAFHVRHSPV